MAVGRAAPRAPYACDPAQSRGRRFSEPESRTRSAFRRDCDRVIHSTAFRRLKHKTQVFVFHEGDHYRTRLTHSLEVAQIARALARQLGLDEDLTETLALAHDLGHPPFGHAGERALDRAMSDFGGFDHNAQTLRVVTALERRYPNFDGLNLTFETLEGILKHNGPLTDAAGHPLVYQVGRGIPFAISDYVQSHDLELSRFASLEAQAAAIADDIAYNAHDIDDGLRAELFTLDDLAEVPLARDLLGSIRARFPGLDDARSGAEFVRELISRLIEDTVATTEAALTSVAPRSVDDIRAHHRAFIAFSTGMATQERAIKQFLKKRMYRHPRVMAVMNEAESVVRNLFSRYQSDSAALPQDWLSGWLSAEAQRSELARARAIGDFIAGMTDRFAIDEHKRLFDSTPELR
jgi:dGTPase